MQERASQLYQVCIWSNNVLQGTLVVHDDMMDMLTSTLGDHISWKCFPKCNVLEEIERMWLMNEVKMVSFFLAD